MKKRPRLQTLLLLVNLIILLLPVGGIYVFRLYESELVKQTEASLIGQGALVATVFRQELARQFELSLDEDEPLDLGYGNPLDPKFALRVKSVYDPVPPRLDIAKDPVLPPGPDARPPTIKADIFSKAAGQAILPLIHASKNITLTGTRVVDHRGTVVASSGSEMGQSLMDRVEVPRALTGEHVSLLRQRPDPSGVGRQSRVRVFVAIPVIQADRVWGAVILSRTPLDMTKALYLIRWHLLKGGLALLGVVLLVTALTTFAISRPVKALIRQADQVASGDKDTDPIKRPGTREVAQLSRALSAMAAALSERAEQLRTFADNVSHGFKTPLTSLAGTVELLRDPDVDMTPEERERFLEMMESDISRLDRLVKRLMDLARADTAAPDKEGTDVRPVLDSLEERYREQGKNLALSFQGGCYAVGMAAASLESVFVNLLENAWLHNPEGTAVEIAVDSDMEGDIPQVLLVVKDNGKGISPANAEKIFTPFFTTAAQQGGSGMGLSIVASLIRSQGGSITLESGKPGACFVITLPYVPMLRETFDNREEI